MINKTYKTVIIDDEPLAIEGVRIRLQLNETFKIIGEYLSVNSALVDLKDKDVDVIFLDIQMPKLNGFDFLTMYKPKSMPIIVFITACDEFAIDAFKVSALDYLLKPIDKVQFLDMLKKVDAQLTLKSYQSNEKKIEQLLHIYGEKKEVRTIKLKSLGNYYSILENDIVCIKAEGDYITVFTNTQNYLVKDTLKHFSSELNNDRFKQIHRSSIVNLHEINHIENTNHNDAIIHLRNKDRIKVSRKYSKEIINSFKHLK